MGKGSTYEREFCKMLSLWWTGNERDDVFWRSQTSGGRATSRRKKGLRTAGQYGDVAATDPIGQRLMDLVTIELKRGYKMVTVEHALTRLPHAVNPTPWEEFYLQARQSASDSGTPFWWLVTRRDGAKDMIWFPTALSRSLKAAGCWDRKPRPFLVFTHDFLVKDAFEPITDCISATTVKQFFRCVKPHHMKGLLT